MLWKYADIFCANYSIKVYSMILIKLSEIYTRSGTKQFFPFN